MRWFPPPLGPGGARGATSNGGGLLTAPLLQLLKRVAADQLAYAPLNNCLTIAYVALAADGRGWAAARAKVVAELPRVQRRGWRLWPAVQLVNQSVVPLEVRPGCTGGCWAGARLLSCALEVRPGRTGGCCNGASRGAVGVHRWVLGWGTCSTGSGGGSMPLPGTPLLGAAGASWQRRACCPPTRHSHVHAPQCRCPFLQLWILVDKTSCADISCFLSSVLQLRVLVNNLVSTCWTTYVIARARSARAGGGGGSGGGVRSRRLPVFSLHKMSAS